MNDNTHTTNQMMEKQLYRPSTTQSSRVTWSPGMKREYAESPFLRKEDFYGMKPGPDHLPEISVSAPDLKASRPAETATPTSSVDHWQPVGKMPGGLLQRNFENRHLVPAGWNQRRQVSPLGLGSSAFGTEHGQLESTMPLQEQLKKTYHFEPPTEQQSPLQQSPQTQSPVSSIVSSRAWTREPSSDQGQGNRKPAWCVIPPEYKFDWSISRDRYLSDRPSTSSSSPLPTLQGGKRIGVSSFSSPEGSRLNTAASSEPRIRMQDPRLPAQQIVERDPVPTDPIWPRRDREPATNKNPTNDFPSWSRISIGYKHDWSIARDRYNLHRFGRSAPQPV
mmetsp:Transcript_63102/g.131166  ORF Transcript_63102/g.131166 Transcript_63102/m.131166 type:complete len:335 (-) Transcript_63102:296-1300(-)